MGTPQEAPRSALPRRPAADVIDAIVQSMHEHLERLKYATLAPSRYLVYLHPTEFARLEGIVPVMRHEAVRALDEAVERLNRRPVLERYRSRLTGRSAPPVRKAADEWQIEFLADADETVEEGGILIDVELLLPSGPEPGAGGLTRRLKTLYQRSRLDPTAPMGSPTATSGVPILAQIIYQDDTGPHSFDIAKPSVTIGRGGTEYPVDIRIAASPDVSREHARIRHDPHTGQFFLIDLSSLGTTLNGRHVPAGFVESDGTKRENHVETPLPDRSRIGLADTVYLDFERKP